MKDIPQYKKQRPSSTPAQEWSQKRNWMKARIVNARSALYPRNEIFTPAERVTAERIENKLNEFINGWDSHNPVSKEQFLVRRKK